MNTTRLPLAHRPAPVWKTAHLHQLESRWQQASPQPLMDQAGLALAQLALALAPHARQICVFAGPGNNGGDGLEAAMHLRRWGRPVQVRLLAEPDKLPADARRAYGRAVEAGVVFTPMATPLSLSTQDLCIDALLGLGTTREPQGALLAAIEQINQCAATVLAVDIPSGLHPDSGQAFGDAVVQADHTLTLLAAKPGLFMGIGRDVCGQLWLNDLDLPKSLAEATPPDAWINQPTSPSPALHASHKGTRGDVAVVGGQSASDGATGMTGAAVLAATAALHTGAGRVLLGLLGPAPAATSWPADLMLSRPEDLNLQNLTVVAGCGGGQAMAEHMGRLLQHSARLVLDADALNVLSRDPWLQDLLKKRRPQTTALTPHPLEAARLLQTTTAHIQSDRLNGREDESARGTVHQMFS
ncbi:NAD(P)H-hydrate epimerase [Limnohabitans sp.]|uniref:NAD(P)H-hydrate epimerase n=1 Tax=Limnohabitans sp. TaxID=1907725 RepID=UPI00311FD734